MANMGDETVDSAITDPPYHLTSIVRRFGSGAAPAQFGTDGAFSRASSGFMGQTWDGGDIAFDPELWAEVLRVLKPGGYLLAFGGTRTAHRMVSAIEAAGFEIRDQIAWVYGSGFPKSHNLEKAFRRAGDEARAEEWAGWGSALKPAFEPICVARKPLAGTLVANVSAHGVGALNIEACRIPAEQRDGRRASGAKGDGGVYGESKTYDFSPATGGRFPANLAHDGSEEVLRAFPSSAGQKADQRAGLERNNRVYDALPETSGFPRRGDDGSAARFFYCGKASRSDREEGLEGLPTRPAGQTGDDGNHITRKDKDIPERANPHPTVKPTALMRWLVRLVTPPGGHVFDPFAGSGSTGKAALLEGCRFLGCEMTEEYIPVARARLEHAEKQVLTGTSC